MSLRLAAACIAGICAAALVWFLARGAGDLQPAKPPTPAASATAPDASLDLAKPEAGEPSITPGNVASREVVATPEPKAAAQEQLPQEGTVAVLVREAKTQSPLAGVQLELHSATEERYGCEPIKASLATPEQCPETDTDGRAVFIVPLGIDYIVSTDFDESCGRVKKEIPAFTQPGRVEVVLEPPTGNDLGFVGRVVADESGAPLPDARVAIQRSDFWMSDEPEPKRESIVESGVDASGFFEIRVPSWTQVHAKVEAPGRSQALAKVGPGHGDRQHAVEVRLSRAAAIDALVLGTTDAPLPKVEVRLTAPSYEIDGTNDFDDSLILGDISWTGVTDDQGRCTIDGLPPQVPLSLQYHLYLEFTRKQAEPLVLQAGEHRELTFRLGSGGIVSGWLVELDGSPATDVDVWLLPSNSDEPRYLRSYEEKDARTGRPDGNGFFRFKDVADGHWLIGPSPDGPYAPRAEVVLLVDGVPDRELRLAAHKGLFINGTVVDPTGAGVPGVFVSGSREGEWGATSDSPSDDGGHFVLGPLVDGAYSVGVLFAAGDLSPGEPIIVNAGTNDVLVRMLPGAGITGTVIDAVTGAPLKASVLLHLAPLKANSAVLMGHADETGHFSFEGLARGTYSLSAVGNGGLVAMAPEVRATPGTQDSDVTLRAEPGSKISIRFEGTQLWAHYTVFSREVVVAIDGIQSGTSKECAVPSGHVRIECRWEGLKEPQVKEVDLQVGEQGEVVFGKEE